MSEEETRLVFGRVQILELRLQGQPIPEIAETVERSERTVRRFLSSFRDQLEERLRTLRED